MFWVTVLIIAFTIVSAAMILIILVQRPQGGGLSGAFGGAGGGSDTVFGGRTGDALTVATVVSFVLFLGFAIGLNLVELPNAANAQSPSTADTTNVPDSGEPLDAGQPLESGTVPLGAPTLSQPNPASDFGETPVGSTPSNPGPTQPGTSGTQPE